MSLDSVSPEGIPFGQSEVSSNSRSRTLSNTFSTELTPNLVRPAIKSITAFEETPKPHLEKQQSTVFHYKNKQMPVGPTVIHEQQMPEQMPLSPAAVHEQQMPEQMPVPRPPAVPKEESGEKLQQFAAQQVRDQSGPRLPPEVEAMFEGRVPPAPVQAKALQQRNDLPADVQAKYKDFVPPAPHEPGILYKVTGLVPQPGGKPKEAVPEKPASTFRPITPEPGSSSSGGKEALSLSDRGESPEPTPPSRPKRPSKEQVAAALEQYHGNALPQSKHRRQMARGSIEAPNASKTPPPIPDRPASTRPASRAPLELSDEDVSNVTFVENVSVQFKASEEDLKKQAEELEKFKQEEEVNNQKRDNEVAKWQAEMENLSANYDKPTVWEGLNREGKVKQLIQDEEKLKSDMATIVKDREGLIKKAKEDFRRCADEHAMRYVINRFVNALQANIKKYKILDQNQIYVARKLAFVKRPIKKPDQFLAIDKSSVFDKLAASEAQKMRTDVVKEVLREIQDESIKAMLVREELGYARQQELLPTLKVDLRNASRKNESEDGPKGKYAKNFREAAETLFKAAGIKDEVDIEAEMQNLQPELDAIRASVDQEEKRRSEMIEGFRHSLVGLKITDPRVSVIVSSSRASMEKSKLLSESEINTELEETLITRIQEEREKEEEQDIESIVAILARMDNGEKVQKELTEKIETYMKNRKAEIDQVVTLSKGTPTEKEREIEQKVRNRLFEQVKSLRSTTLFNAALTEVDKIETDISAAEKTKQANDIVTRFGNKIAGGEKLLGEVFKVTITRSKRAINLLKDKITEKGITI